MNIAEIVRMTLTMVTFSSMCFILLDRKYSLKKTLSIFGVFVAAAIVLNATIAMLFGWEKFTVFYVPVTNGLITVGLFVLSKRKGFPVVFNMLTATVFTHAPALMTRIYILETEQSVWAETLIRLILGIPFIIIFYRYLRPYYMRMLTIMKKGWGYLCLIPSIYYILCIFNFVIFPYHTASEYRRVCLNCLFALAITIVAYGVIFTLFGIILHEAEMRDEQQLLKIQMQAMERHADMLKENTEKVQIFRHDLRHYVADIKVLIESGNTKEALRILGSFDEQTINTSVPHYCDNPTVNAILVYYIQKAEHDGITVETDCRLPEHLPTEASELAMVLANAIENAIHACGRIAQDGERLIKIKLVSSPQLAIEISNSYAGRIEFDENGIPVSTESGHGLGTKSISAFVERHDGIIEYNADGKLFRLRLLVGAE